MIFLADESSYPHGKRLKHTALAKVWPISVPAIFWQVAQFMVCAFRLSASENGLDMVYTQCKRHDFEGTNNQPSIFRQAHVRLACCMAAMHKQFEEFER